jgi:hypothetical protein
LQLSTIDRLGELLSLKIVAENPAAKIKGRYIMATIGSDPNGRKRILFVAGDGTRKTIRLGKASMRQAETFKVKVEDLVGAANGAARFGTKRAGGWPTCRT